MTDLRVVRGADQTLADAVEQGGLPGVVALAADRAGVIYAGAAGRRRLGGSEPMTLDTVFGIASMTKAVTATAALQLVEAGRLTLDEPVAARVSELANVMVLDGFDAEGEARLRPPRGPITLRHLLTHTSGFGYATWNPDLFRLEQARGEPLGPYAPVLAFEPGTRWEYGTSIDWIGVLIERVVEQSLDDYFRAHIFDPLGMHDSGFILRDELRARLAGRHQRDEAGTLAVMDVELPTVPAHFLGGGGLYSTGPDYLRFLRMLLGEGELDGARVVSAASVAEFARNHIGELNVNPLPTSMPSRSNDVELFPGMVKKWSLGGLINTEPVSGGRSAGSWAWAGMMNTYFWLDPIRGITGLILTQLLPFCDATVLATFAQFERDIYAALDR